ncbi:MAG: hypothetical protein AAF383_19670 [Cyanobacteria bacterium P01_A01_bin.83]
MNPNNWFTTLFICALITIISVSYGWLVQQQILPFRSVMAFSNAQQQFIKVWASIAVLIGIIIPAVMLIVFWDRSMLRNFFSCYLVAVFIQLLSEIILSRTLCKSVVVIIGTLYTGFRIWQLWLGLHLITYSQPWLSLLYLVFFFWVANMIMLTTMAIPSILPQSDDYESVSGE